MTESRRTSLADVQVPRNISMDDPQVEKKDEEIPDTPLRSKPSKDTLQNTESAAVGAGAPIVPRRLSTAAMIKPSFNVAIPEQETEEAIMERNKLRDPFQRNVAGLPPTPALTPGSEVLKRLPNGAHLGPIAPLTPAATPGSELGPFPAPGLPAKDAPAVSQSTTEFPLPKTEPPVPRPRSPVAQILPDVPSPASAKETWDKTLAKVFNGIVSIKATGTRNFDTEGAGDYTATGFVIDKEKGLILSNRHVVSPAPITAVAVFVNYEEVPIQPIYRDPTHDFGVFRYDPSKLKHIKVEEIELCPDAAKVGEDIKVVGNDSGEKLSILGSTLARLDREAPSYGTGSYNDFNTFYMQAASGTSGGSSGSPVLNIHGQAVALNAGGSNSSQSSFYLPLNRVVRAVKYIKAGKEVPRGTLQTEFQHQSYDELRRLGLSEDEEKACRERNPQANGLLSVVRVLRGGPASSYRDDIKPGPEDGVARVNGLEPSDILLRCNGVPIIDFIGLWEIIDESVNADIALSIIRGGKTYECVLTVQDLHSITPSRFLEFGGAILHDLSYQIGRNYNVQLKTGVFCAASGFLFWSTWKRDFLITSIDGRPTRTLDELVEVLGKIPDGSRVPMMCRYIGSSNQERHIMIDVDRHFFAANLFERDDANGTWQKRELEAPPPKPADSAEAAVEKKAAAAADEDEDLDDAGEDEHAAVDSMRNSLVSMVARLPYSVFGYTSSSDFSSVGMLIQKEPIPLVLFDRCSVPTEMLDIRLTLCSKEIQARVVHLGQVALMTFPSDKMPAEAVVPEWDDVPLKVRDKVKVIGLQADHFVVKDTTISSIGLGFNTWHCNPPRHRLINVEDINVLEGPSCWGGVIARQSTSDAGAFKFKVAAYYMAVSSQDKNGDSTYWRQGIDIRRYVLPLVDRINAEDAKGPVEPEVRGLGLEFADMSLATVSSMGLSQDRFEWFQRMAKRSRRVPRPLVVESKLMPSLPCADPEAAPKIADVVLEIDGVKIERVSQLTDLDFTNKDRVDMVVLRDRKELTLTVPIHRLFPTSTSRVVIFFGAILHETHAGALEQAAPDASLVPLSSPGVYVGGVSYGSPSLDKIRPTHWLLEIDGEEVSCLEDVLEVVRRKRWAEGQYVRVKQVTRKGITGVVSVRVDTRFWPCLAVGKREGGGWGIEKAIRE